MTNQEKGDVLSLKLAMIKGLVEDLKTLPDSDYEQSIAENIINFGESDIELFKSSKEFRKLFTEILERFEGDIESLIDMKNNFKKNVR